MKVLYKYSSEKALRTLAICVKYDCGLLNDYDGIDHPGYQLIKDSKNY